ncbi:MAG: DUF4349 domain-containing protein [Defluviitaleaceae bacterium]|nr:DUF4349 domain-containing protein [Defluviitaleaceae bacterium]
MKRYKFLIAGLAAAVLALSACAGRAGDYWAMQDLAAYDDGFIGSAGGGMNRERLEVAEESRVDAPVVEDWAPMVADMPMPVSTPILYGRAGEDWTASAAELTEERLRGDVDWEEIAERDERHIIQNAVVEMETEDFGGVVDALRGIADGVGGYVESELLTTRSLRRVFTIVMRVPTGEFSAALAHAESLAEIRTSSQTAQDVTDQFYDAVSSLETRRIEENRLLALIDEAENIHDLLALETRLTNTRMAIETYLAQLNNLAGQIAFSTITVTLFDASQAPPAAPTAFGDRIGGAFGDSIDGTVRVAQNIVVFFAGAIIPLGIFGAFVFGIYLFVKTLIRRSRRPRATVK